MGPYNYGSISGLTEVVKSLLQLCVEPSIGQGKEGVCVCVCVCVCVRAVIAPYFMMLCITSPDIATQLRNTHVAALLKPG